MEKSSWSIFHVKKHLRWTWPSLIINEFQIFYGIINNKRLVIFKTFKQFLLDKGAAKPQSFPYYLKWVSECYAFLDVLPATRINTDQRQGFLTHTSKRHEDWQVKQADTALRLYDYFPSREIKATAEGIRAAAGDWNMLEEKMREKLRLRQRAVSTEKTYLTWVRSFRAFVHEKDPSDLEGRDLQDFLSRLAVEKKVSPSTQNQALNAVVFFSRHVLLILFLGSLC